MEVRTTEQELKARTPGLPNTRFLPHMALNGVEAMVGKGERKTGFLVLNWPLSNSYSFIQCGFIEHLL